MIFIRNLRTHKPKNQPNHIRIDRGTPFGNPFHMATEDRRDMVINQYKDYFYSNEALMAKTAVLRDTHEIYGDLYLYCWSAPKRCHGDILKEFIENRRF